MTHERFWSDEEEEYSPSWPDTCSICMRMDTLFTADEDPPNYTFECGNCGHSFLWISRSKDSP